MSPSANGQKPAAAHRIYIVERRSEFRELNSQIDPNADQQPYEPEISYLDYAYVEEKQAYAVAIREQILELDENFKHNGRKFAAQTNVPLKERLKSIHKEVDVAAEKDPEAPVVKFEVLEFPVAPVQPFQESEFLKELENQSESEDVEDEEEEEDGDEEEGEEEGDEGEEGLEEVEGEEEDDEEEVEEDPEEADDDGGEDEDEDEDDDEDDGAPQTKKQRT